VRRLHGTPRIAALFLALLAGLPACSSTSASDSAASRSMPVGRRVVVGLYDSRGPVHLELAPDNHPDFADVYSHPRPDAALKLAPPELVDDLLRDLERLSFGALSAPGGPPPAGPGVRGWVTLQDGSQRRTFVVPASGAPPEALQAFAYMKLLVNEYYTHVGGLQFVNNPEGHDIFRRSP
jgi:hypothetical protein